MSTASESFPSTEKRQRLRRGGSQCSHTTRLDVPLLELGSNMSLQLAHERNGLLLSHAHSSNCTDRTRIMRALQQSDVDLSKAQACGHCHQLTARLAESLLHHLLFAKGQLPEPVSLLRKRREVAFFATSTSSRHRLRNNSARTRKEDKVLRKLDQFRLHLEEAAKHLSALADNNGEGPSRRPYPSLSPSISSHDVRLLVVMGASASMPREVFVLDLLQAVGRRTSAEDALDHLSCPNDFQHDEEESNIHLAELLSEVSESKRDTARDKTSTNWERKLVRLLVSNERLEPFLGTPLAPTKMHVFLSAPASFRCPGWSARQHLDFDLDRLCEAHLEETPISSTDTSMSSRGFKKPSSSPLPSEDGRWCRSACESTSSVAESWPEDSASEQLGESSVSSISDDSRPPSAADKSWHINNTAQGWLPRCSSPLIKDSQIQGQTSEPVKDYNIEMSRTGSSLGSSTVYGHDSHDVAAASTPGIAEMLDDASVPTASGSSQLTSETKSGLRRRSREPKAGSLLSRNLLRGPRSRQQSYTGSEASSARSSVTSIKRAPRCAGLQINFSDPDQARAASHVYTTQDSRDVVDRCWFQCEAVLEGFR